MMLNFFLQLGPLPVPPPEHRGVMQWIGEAIPFLIVGSAVLAMLLSILLRYSQRFLEFCSTKVCTFAEKHKKSDETKGGM